jgi:integrase
MGKMEDFLSRHEAATRHSYEISLKQFFEWKHTDPDNYIKDLRKLSNGKKETVMEEYEKDIKAWWQYIKKTWNPKYTRNTKLNAIRQYLIEYHIELPIVFWKRLKTSKEKGPRAATQDRAPTRHELRKIILEGKPIARTMFLLASCTGMRIGEILQLKMGDIDLSMTPIWINIRGETTKTGDARTVFVSDEAAIYLRKWMNEQRGQYLKDVKQRMERLSTHKNFKGLKDHHKTDDGRVFPITRQTAESYWQLMLKRSNLDKHDQTTNIRELHLHTLRKYFRTNMAKPLGLDITEAIMGHRGYLTESYRRYSKQDLAKMYQENQEYITVIQEPRSLEKLDADSKMKDEKIKELTDKLDYMVNLLGVKKQFEDMLEKQRGITK